MSIATEITRLETARNTIRDKAVELGIATGTSKLDVLAEAIDKIENKGAVSAQVQEGDTYTIPKGYHNGSGTVSGVAGGGNYSLQSKTVTPTKSQQNVTPDSGYYGLSDVTVNAIPEAYQNVSSVDATAADVLANKKIVTADGTVTAGTMPNNGTVTKTLDTATTSYTIPKGYHSGSGKVSITTEEKAVTLSRAEQTITPTSGKVLSKVTVPAISNDLQDVSGVTAVAANVLAGDVFVDSTGAEITGTMANNGDVTATMDGLTVTSISIPAGYTSGGAVSLTSDIEDALAAI